MTFDIIAYIKSDFPEKFGIPRQSGLTELTSKIIFKPEYRVREAFRGLSGYSHIWILWQFSEAVKEGWSPTVRPPKLGGNKRMGVFATRSPFRPNPIAISAVKLQSIDYNDPEGPVLYVRGADLMDGTPIIDIKPYVAYSDAYPEAISGFAQDRNAKRLKVEISEAVLKLIPEEKREGLIEALSQDPRPGYKTDAERVYTMSFDKYQISFIVNGEAVIVINISQ